MPTNSNIQQKLDYAERDEVDIYFIYIDEYYSKHEQAIRDVKTKREELDILYNDIKREILSFEDDYIFYNKEQFEKFNENINSLIEEFKKVALSLNSTYEESIINLNYILNFSDSKSIPEKHLRAYQEKKSRILEICRHSLIHSTRHKIEDQKLFNERIYELSKNMEEINTRKDTSESSIQLLQNDTAKLFLEERAELLQEDKTLPKKPKEKKIDSVGFYALRNRHVSSVYDEHSLEWPNEGIIKRGSGNNNPRRGNYFDFSNKKESTNNVERFPSQTNGFYNTNRELDTNSSNSFNEHVDDVQPSEQNDAYLTVEQIDFLAKIRELHFNSQSITLELTQTKDNLLLDQKLFEELRDETYKKIDEFFQLYENSAINSKSNEELESILIDLKYFYNITTRDLNKYYECINKLNNFISEVELNILKLDDYALEVNELLNQIPSNKTASLLSREIINTREKMIRNLNKFKTDQSIFIKIEDYFKRTKDYTYRYDQIVLSARHNLRLKQNLFELQKIEEDFRNNILFAQEEIFLFNCHQYQLKIKNNSNSEINTPTNTNREFEQQLESKDNSLDAVHMKNKYNYFCTESVDRKFSCIDENKSHQRDSQNTNNITINNYPNEQSKSLVTKESADLKESKSPLTIKSINGSEFTYEKSSEILFKTKSIIQNSKITDTLEFFILTLSESIQSDGSFSEITFNGSKDMEYLLYIYSELFKQTTFAKGIKCKFVNININEESLNKLEEKYKFKAKLQEKFYGSTDIDVINNILSVYFCSNDKRSSSEDTQKAYNSIISDERKNDFEENKSIFEINYSEQLNKIDGFQSYGFKNVIMAGASEVVEKSRPLAIPASL